MTTSTIKGILCDIGGVLYEGDTPYPGAVEAIARLKAVYPVRFVTNTTQKRGADVVAKLQRMGFRIEASEVITALDVTKAYLIEHHSRATFLLTDSAQAFFDDLPDAPCRCVVIGDAQENFTYARLNAAFRTLMEGGELLAAAKNRYFKDHSGRLSMDAGGFVAALEYASDKTATVIGKPSADFYRLACAQMGLAPEAAVMIGDDIESDVGGAQAAGLRGILVETGKYTPADLTRGITPDAVFPSLAEVTL
ncbi:TIGR01458 family HAD-type hydrolase [Sulfurimonas sp. HSL-3221]|uniref:TIGR01458 family HAD-type hydrolase n=1 Tax=Sulfurimonadaceae TaxID=2771471 RepID=UPI001E3BF774|nr:TIGR01458 family HAD-type hydrolase [Sulfurimonas sp. HSL-3221]UFS61603.1 TIGR01458 family HAD-type hydrolase [Sulfurimonas sp. HSL-3221]